MTRPAGVRRTAFALGLAATAALVPGAAAAAQPAVAQPGAAATGIPQDLRPMVLRRGPASGGGPSLVPTVSPTGSRTPAASLVMDADVSFHGTLTDPVTTRRAEVAVRRAIALWQQRLSTGAVLGFDVTFAPTDSGILATARPGGYHTDPATPGLQISDSAYAGRTDRTGRFFGANVRVVLSNSEPGMYVGTDGRPGAGHVDLQTIALHAVANGLGMMGDFDVRDGMGSYGRSLNGNGIDRYDTVFSNGDRDLTSYRDNAYSGMHSGTAELATALTDGNLRACGTTITSPSAQACARIHSPSPFQPGSSGLFDETTYPAGDANSLMTPVLQEQEAVHEPGLLAFALLRPLGYRTAEVPAASLPSDLELRYAQEPALRSLLGAAVSGETVSGGVHERAYERGRLYSSPATGVVAMYGSILDAYLRNGGPRTLGLPLAEEVDTADRQARVVELAGGGSLYWTSTTGAHAVYGAIRAQWLAAGGPAGLGYPTRDESPVGDGVGRVSGFSRGGSVYWTPATGAHAVYGSVRARWLAVGGTRTLGYPVTDELGVADGVGRYNDFSNGASVYWTPSTGAHAIYGAIRQAWFDSGGAAALGYPTADEADTADHRGRSNEFSGGASVIWSPATGAHPVYGAIRARWVALGGVTSYLRYPTSGETGPGLARKNTFQGGLITWSPDTGARDRRW